MKKILYVIFALSLSILGSLSIAHAKEQNQPNLSTTDSNVRVVYEDEEKALLEYEVQPRDTGYGNAWSTTGSGSFTVYTPYSGTLGFTFKVESDSSSWASINVIKPNGSAYLNNLAVSAGQEAKSVAYGAPSGTYTVKFSGYTTSGMRVMCWIYKA